MTSSSRIHRWERVVWPLVAFAACFAVWHVAVRWSGTTVLPGPMKVGRGMVELAHKGILWPDIADSLRRVGEGFGLAVLLGVPVGLLLGWYSTASRVVTPTLEILRPISPIAWIPLAIVIFGIGDRPAVFLIFLGAVFPIITACADAVSSVPAVYRQAGRNFGLSPLQLMTRVIFPASLPRVLTGLRLALGIAWLVVVAAEMVAVTSGLGYLVIDSRNAGKRYDLVVAAMVLIGGIGLLLDSAFRQIERLRSVQWGFRREY